MAEKNIRFQEWLERFNLLVDQSIAELRGIKVKARRVGAVCQTPHRRRSRTTSKAPKRRSKSREPSEPPQQRRRECRLISVKTRPKKTFQPTTNKKVERVK